MLGVKITARASYSHKALVGSAVSPYLITLLSSKGNSNRFDLPEKHFLIFRT